MFLSVITLFALVKLYLSYIFYQFQFRRLFVVLCRLQNQCVSYFDILSRQSKHRPQKLQIRYSPSPIRRMIHPFMLCLFI